MDKFVTMKLERVEQILKSAINKMGQIKKCRLQEEERIYTLENLFEGLSLLDDIRIKNASNGREGKIK